MTLTQDVNVGFAFLEAAARHHDRLAVFNDNIAISYGQLLQLTIRLARGMQARGIGQGATVALRSDDIVAVLSAMFATGLLGARWMIVNGPDDLLERAGVTHLLDASPEGEPPLAGAMRLDESWLARTEGGAPAAPFPGYSDPDAVWVIWQTSGTTGYPKLVGLSHRVMTGRNRSNADLFPREGMRITGLFQPGAPALMSRYMAGLLHGATIMADPDPEAWVRHRVDLVFGSPNHLRQFLGNRVLPERLSRVYLGGASASDGQVRHLLKSFETVSNGYGSTEGFNCLSTDHRIDGDGEVRIVVTPRPDVTVEVVDRAGRPVTPGQEGIVRIRTEWLANGYIDDPDLTAEIFRDGCFYPGDLGSWSSDGVFRVTGRVNDQFNIGGVKINGAVLDAAIQRVPGVEDALCFMVPVEDAADRLTAFVQLAPGAVETDVFGAIRIELMRLGSPTLIPERLLRSDRVPRTATGKPDRGAAIAAVLAARAARNAPK